MFELSSLDIGYAVQELSQLVGAKIEKVFQSDTHKRDIFFILYLQDAPKVHLRFLLPGMVYFAKEKPAYPTQPPGFAMFLRKYLSGARLQSVTQEGFDRVIKFNFATKASSYTLVVELMAPGNMLLLDAEGRIINLLENQQFKDRNLKGKQMYVPPTSVPLQQLDSDGLVQHMSQNAKDTAVTTLAIGCSLGGVYAEEVCARAGVLKSTKDISLAQLQSLATSLHELLRMPIAAHCDQQRAYPFPLTSRTTHACSASGFLASLEPFIASDPLVGKVEAAKRTREAPQSKLQIIIDAQRAQVAKMQQEVEASQRKGERIFEEYLVISQILQDAREARSKKADVLAALQVHRQVKSYNARTGELELELDE